MIIFIIHNILYSMIHMPSNSVAPKWSLSIIEFDRLFQVRLCTAKS